MLKYFFSLIIILAVLAASAQNGVLQQMGQKMNQGGGKAPAVTMKDLRELRKLEKKDWSLNYVKFSYDIIPTGRMLFKPNQKSQEFQISTSFYRYFFMLEAGFQDFTRAGSIVQTESNSPTSAYTYTNNGSFFRIGPEVNLIKINPLGGAITFGVRYARSRFSDRLSFSRQDAFGDNAYSFKNDNANLAWLEITTGLNLVVYKNIHMGYTIRYKAFRKFSGVDKLDPFRCSRLWAYRKWI